MTDYILDSTRRRIGGRVAFGETLARQRILKILGTPRGEYGIYPAGFGLRLDDLYGKDPAYASGEAAARVRNALAPYGYTVSDVAVSYARGRVALSFKAVYDGGEVAVSI
ncbi:hypothetical protein FACS1894133_5020 [Clostridia bacterium]|nr:hypothetical protein FACS1894133_5020 [Clostridia bacterium]